MDVVNINNEIKERVGIVDAVQRAGIELKHNKACCPFHTEKTPSFSVHPAKNIFKCFGCGAGGDVIGFTMQFYNVDYMSALKKLNTDFNLGFSFEYRKKDTPEDAQERIRDAIDRTIHRIYAERFERCELALRACFRRMHRVIFSIFS